MDGNSLADFRVGFVDCCGRERAALSDLCDALATDDGARPLVELTDSPLFQRKWPSVYKALSRGSIDQEAVLRLFAEYAPMPRPGQRTVLAVDVRPMPRPDARTAADRMMVHVPNMPVGAAPVRPGGQFSAVVVVPAETSSRTHVLDNRRVPSNETAVTIGAVQLQAIVDLRPQRPLVLADGGYGTDSWLQATKSIAADQLIRLARNTVFYRPAPPPTKKRGAPRKDGARFQCADPTTHGEPDEHGEGLDEKGAQVRVDVWHTLHRKQCRDLPLRVIRREERDSAHPDNKPPIIWCYWVGEALPPLEDLAPLYLRRFSIAHGFRFDKQDLLWTGTLLRTPEQAQLWTYVVAPAHNAIEIARAEATIQRRAWESNTRDPSPRQVRRAMGRIFVQPGSPVPAPQTRGKSPGRAKGTRPPRAPRHPVVYKTPRRHRKRRNAT